MLFRLIACSAAALMIPSLALTAPVALAQPTGDLARVRQHLTEVETMVAQFSQTDRAGQVLSGTLTLKKPGRIRFQYQKGVPYLIVSDGRGLTFIDYSVKQVQRWPIGSSPLGILLNPKRELGNAARVVPSNDPRVLSVEASDPKHPEYGRITLIFARDAAAPAGLMLQGWVALDSQGNRTSIRLSAQRFNTPVGDDTFRWRDPRRMGRPGLQG